MNQMDEQLPCVDAILSDIRKRRKTYFEPVTVEYELDADIAEDLEPIHGAFSLTYANYMVWHRSLMEAMPLDWQRMMAQLIREYWDTWDCDKVIQDFEVRHRDEQGRYRSDPLSEYRHPDREYIESCKRAK